MGDIANRMYDYYPEVIKTILEFKVITTVEGSEFDDLSVELDSVMNNAYLLTMEEPRVILWENLLGIVPLEDSSISDRRETVIARIRGQGKLNTSLISNIVNVFTGGSANSWVKDGVLYVEITPPPNNKQYRFENVEQELSLKVPAHLGFQVYRNYYTWDKVKQLHPTWQDVKNNFDTWVDVKLSVPFE